MQENVVFFIKELEDGKCILNISENNKIVSLLSKESIEFNDINDALQMIEDLKSSIIEVEYKNCKYYRA